MKMRKILRQRTRKKIKKKNSRNIKIARALTRLSLFAQAEHHNAPIQILIHQQIRVFL